MGIASLLLGAENPFAQWTNQNQNLLGAIGAGLGQGQNIQSGLSAGLSQLPQAKQLDQIASEKLKAEKLAETQANATQNWLQANHPDLAQMVQAGMPVSEAWQTAMDRMKPQAAPKPIEINGQLVDPNTYDVLGDFRTPETPKEPTAPTGYRFGVNGSLEYIPGGPADPATAGKTTEATRRNQQLAKVIIPEMQTLEQNWNALADVGNQAAGSNDMTMGLTSPQYQQAKNSLKTIIASYLYSVSGATANPGEVENQASILTPRFGESPESVQAKLARVKTMVQAVVEAAQGAPFDPAGGGGDDVDAILSGLGI